MNIKANQKYCESTCQIEETSPVEMSDVIGGVDDPFYIFMTPKSQAKFTAAGAGEIISSGLTGNLGGALSGIVQIGVVSVPDAKP